MTDDEVEIRKLIERWVRAVAARDLAGVLADHSEDVVMFDVPPPYEGAHGIEAYRQTWPDFFRWLEQGAVFELTSLTVTAGDTVAFAHALLRCGMPQELAEQPQLRLRLTVGLRRERGRWVISHEHHSFPDNSAAEPDNSAEQQ